MPSSSSSDRRLRLQPFHSEVVNRSLTIVNWVGDLFSSSFCILRKNSAHTAKANTIFRPHVFHLCNSNPSFFICCWVYLGGTDPHGYCAFSTNLTFVRIRRIFSSDIHRSVLWPGRLPCVHKSRPESAVPQVPRCNASISPLVSQGQVHCRTILPWLEHRSTPVQMVTLSLHQPTVKRTGISRRCLCGSGWK